MEISAEKVSTIVEAINETVEVWQNPPLEDVTPILHMDAFQIKVTDPRWVGRFSLCSQMFEPEECAEAWTSANQPLGVGEMKSFSTRRMS